MSSDKENLHAPLHRGPAHSAPYPVSRLSAPLPLVDLAREVAEADRLLTGVAEGKLRLIAEQIRALQAQARAILEQTRDQQDLHRVECSFKRVPGHTYHLYRRADGSRYFSMLGPDDWGGSAPHEHLGAWRLAHDLTWQGAGAPPEPAADLVRGLLDEFRLL